MEKIFALTIGGSCIGAIFGNELGSAIGGAMGLTFALWERWKNNDQA